MMAVGKKTVAVPARACHRRGNYKFLRIRKSGTDRRQSEPCPAPPDSRSATHGPCERPCSAVVALKSCHGARVQHAVGLDEWEYSRNEFAEFRAIRPHHVFIAHSLHDARSKHCVEEHARLVETLRDPHEVERVDNVEGPVEDPGVAGRRQTIAVLTENTCLAVVDANSDEVRVIEESMRRNACRAMEMSQSRERSLDGVPEEDRRPMADRQAIHERGDKMAREAEIGPDGRKGIEDLRFRWIQAIGTAPQVLV